MLIRLVKPTVVFLREDPRDPSRADGILAIPPQSVPRSAPHFRRVNKISLNPGTTRFVGAEDRYRDRGRMWLWLN